MDTSVDILISINKNIIICLSTDTSVGSWSMMFVDG